MYIDKLIRKEVITLLISVGFLVVVFIGVTFAKFLSVDKGEKTVINMGDLNISFCSDSTCDTTYSNIGQVIGTKVENGVTVPASIYPFKNDATYSNETPYIFKVENTGTLDSTVKIKLKEDATYTPTGDYSSYTRLSLKYPEHLKVAIRKRVLYQDTGYQLGDVNMDGIVNKTDVDLILDYAIKGVTFSDLQKKLADINGKDGIDANDVTYLLQLINGKKNIEGAAPTYVYSYTDLEDGVIFKDDIIKAGESATYFLWLYLDESTPNDVQNTFFVGNIDVEGEFIPRNTVFCTTDTELTQGAEYVNGQYTYRYKQEGSLASSGLAWQNITSDGWGVQLTDKTSTDPVTSEVCTYINNKPITSMASMFEESQATSIDLSSFNTSNVTSMNKMFRYTVATTLDLSNFNTSNVTNMSQMFFSSNATTIKGLENFDTSNVTTMNSMFAYSQAATINGLESFDTSNVTSMYRMFYDSQVTSLNLSNFDTSKVKNMSGMFASIIGVTTLNLSNFDTSKVKNMSEMFASSIVGTLDLSNFDTSSVTNMSYMFSEMLGLRTIYVSDKFKTDSVTSGANMFFNSTNLVGGEGTVYNSNNVDVTYARIDGGTSNPGYFTEKPSNPKSFSSDSWTTIAYAARTNNLSKYNIGDTKTIDMGTYGTHTLRIANTSTPSECSMAGFSQSACGFVLEFADIITSHKMNDTTTNKGGWPASSMYTFVNNDIYNAIPSELRNEIIDTTVVSGHGSTSGEKNFTSTDKLYLLAPGEVWADWKTSSRASYDTAKDLTRTLDYYTAQGVTLNSYSGAIKKIGTSTSSWWLRAAYSRNDTDFYLVHSIGGWDYDNASYSVGVAPAFRLNNM